MLPLVARRTAFWNCHPTSRGFALLWSALHATMSPVTFSRSACPSRSFSRAVSQLDRLMVLNATITVDQLVIRI